MPTRRDRADAGSANGSIKLSAAQQRRVDDKLAGKNPKCGANLAHSKQRGHENFGKTCKQPAGMGTDHPGSGPCKMHGGCTTALETSAARERVAAELATQRRFYGQRVQIDFGQAMLEELQRTVGVVRWLEDKLAQWGTQPGQDADGQPLPPKWDSSDTGLPNLMDQFDSFRSVTIADSEFAAWLRVYQAERRHLHQIARDGVASGIAKSLIQIYQQQADMMYRILSLSLQRLGVQDPSRIATVLPGVIREITGAGPQQVA